MDTHAPTEAQLGELRQELDRLKAGLEEILRDSEAGARPVDLEEPIGRLSRMDAMQQREMARSNLSAHKRRLESVEEAISAFDEGVYGLCILCDQAVSYARLKAIPEAATCLSCQERQESG
jgi:DnaK suppressor protein